MPRTLFPVTTTVGASVPKRWIHCVEWRDVRPNLAPNLFRPFIHMPFLHACRILPRDRQRVSAT